MLKKVDLEVNVLENPFISYIYEDKSKYPFSSSNGYIDPYDDFRIGNSGGFLMNIDFTFVDTHLFCEAASNYRKFTKLGFSGKEAYAGAREGTEKYNNFWRIEKERRRKGMIAPCKVTRSGKIESLHITGDHYFYLNYSRMIRVPTQEEKEILLKAGRKSKKITDFPQFRDGDYWRFKLDQFARVNGFNICNGKARRKGYSYGRSAEGANTLNDNPDVTVIFVAFDLGYLTDSGATADMLKRNLDWLETNTIWRRGFLGESITNIETGYKKTGDHRKYGYRSKALSVSCQHNTSAAIGKDAIEIDFEEAGKNRNLRKTLDVTLSATEAGDEKVGIIRVYGTAGEKEADWEDFAYIYYNPGAYGMLPMENVWDRNARNSTCGFFHPQIWTYEGYIDDDGNSDVEGAYRRDYHLKAEKKRVASSDNYMNYLGQRANSPEEAFLSGVENLFNSPELRDHITRIRHDKELRFYRDGTYVLDSEGKSIFKTNEQLELEGTKTHPFIEKVPFDPSEDFHGCVREFFPPFYSENGTIPDNLYYGVYDPVGKSKTDSKEITIEHSLAAWYILMYPTDLVPGGGDIIVASYAGRTTQMEEDDRQFLLALMRWNAKGLVEVDRGNTVANFRRWGRLNYLAKNPLNIISEKSKRPLSDSYGINMGGGEKSKDSLIYHRDWLYEPVTESEMGMQYKLHFIYDLSTLLEHANYKEGGNFDRISALKLATFQRLAYRVLKKKPSEIKEKTLLESIRYIEDFVV